MAEAFPGTPKAQRLVMVCQGLQALAGDEPFFLSARMAATVLGVTDGKYAHKLLSRLVRGGYLVPVERGTLASRLATTWRFGRPNEGQTQP